MYDNPEKLTTKLFKQYCAIVYSQCGIRLNDDKRELLHARLIRCLRKLDMRADEYLKLIQSDARELDNFVDAVSTNHTFFFRESASFEYIDENCRYIWCAAASSGEEPYSLAAYCYSREYRTSILATDISGSCLDKGRRGLYPIESCRYIPMPALKQCFQKGKNHWSAYMRVKPEIKKMVQFERFNLLSDPLPERVFDIIFCRNVMIYFDSPTKERVVHHLCRVLRGGGYFIIGGAESLNGLSHGLAYIAPSVYQKR